MEAHLDFKLPEDKKDFEVACHGMSWAFLVLNLDIELKNFENCGRFFGREFQNVHEFVSFVRQQIQMEMHDKGLKFPS